MGGLWEPWAGRMWFAWGGAGAVSDQVKVTVGDLEPPGRGGERMRAVPKGLRKWLTRATSGIGSFMTESVVTVYRRKAAWISPDTGGEIHAKTVDSS